MKHLIVITTPFFFDGEAELINRLFGEGMEILHLRKPEATAFQIIRLLKQINPQFHKNIILHDHFELASEFLIGGVHLNRRNLVAPLHLSGTVSRSCHSIEELTQFPELDYLFLSPIFQSISKEGYGNGYPMEQLRKASGAGIVNERVIALGGIDASTMPLLQNLNFGGVAVLGALWGNMPDLCGTIERFHLLEQAFYHL